MQEITSEDEDEDEEAEDRKRRRSTLKRRSTTSSSSRQRISATERPSIVNLHVRFADSADSSSVEGDESTNTTKPSTSSSPLWRKPGNISISTASPTYSSPAAARSPATNQRLISEQLKQNLRQKAETQQTNQQVRSNLLLKIQRTNSTSSSLSPISYVSSPKSASASIPPPSSARPTHHTDEMDEEVGGGDDEEEEVGSATSSTMPPMSSVSRKPSKQKYGFGRRASSQVSSPMSPQIRARIAESLKNSAIVKE